MTTAMDSAIRAAADGVWGVPTIVLLFGTGLFLTVRYRFIQIRSIGGLWKSLRPQRDSPSVRGPLTPLQAFATALAGSVGTGTIAGVATAIVSGGPGAVFWIWCFGFFATVIKLSEAVLGLIFRVSQADSNSVSSGPMYYLRDGMGLPSLAWIYALLAGAAALFTTPFTQPNSVALVLESQFHCPRLASGIALAILTWVVVIGGVKSIGRTLEKIVPLKMVLYLACGLLVIAFHIKQVPATFAMILREAFSMRGVRGGIAGTGMLCAMRYGMARGVRACEAGMGSAAVAYGAARSRRPVDQGRSAILDVYIISLGTSSVTAFAILTSGVWHSGLTSTALVAKSFDSTLPGGGWILAFCAFLFGYSALIGWAYYGEQFCQYIFGPRVVLPYRWTFSLLVVIGAVVNTDTVWAWGDLLNALQIFPNLVGVLGLSGIVARRVAEATQNLSIGRYDYP
jgi:alanine or glycine:cation symporter, AGCS family